MGVINVAVIGAGISGLAALKNLREEGFDATCFESRDSIGGVWKFTEENLTSVLPSTIGNVSKFKNCFTDFPFPDDVPAHPTAPQIQAYLESYVKHFDLEHHIQLNTQVKEIHRNANDTKWVVPLRIKTGSEQTLEFDKVVVCNGAWGRINMPKFEGQELFKGKITHVQSFKRPTDYEGMRVVVLGLGNSAADTAGVLVGHASKVYLSHRRGANLLPRICDGKPLDLNVTRRHTKFRELLETMSPDLSERFFNWFCRTLTTKSFKLSPEWAIHPPPSIKTHQPTISDDLIPNLEKGSVTSIRAIRRITGPKELELDDGTIIQVDAIICCTGYLHDFSLIPELQPKPNSTPAWESSPFSNREPLPRLYMNIFPPTRASSIAYTTNYTFPVGFTYIADLASMAIAQVWKEEDASPSSTLPSEPDMNAWVDSHHAWLADLVQKDTVYMDLVEEKGWLRWLHDTAGTGLNENLGYGWQGWWFWLRNPWFCNLLMGGVESPLVDRLFESSPPNKGRKRWDGAKDAIIGQNSEAKKFSV